MRLMIFSDIHGNIGALEAVLAHSQDKGIHRYICLGDIVGYGPHPNECIHMVKSLKNCRSVAGNHDLAALWEASPYGMSPDAKEVILWTMEQLTPQNKTFLQSLPDRIDFSEMSFAHANPYNPRGWRYVTDRKYALCSFSGTLSRMSFIGHSHRPLLITRKNILMVDFTSVSGVSEFKVLESKRCIVNCGSIGQPRDRDPRPCYLIFDTRRHQLTFYRVSYDASKSARAVFDAGLPRGLGMRLLKGI